MSYEPHTHTKRQNKSVSEMTLEASLSKNLSSKGKLNHIAKQTTAHSSSPVPTDCEDVLSRKTTT